MNKKNSLSAWGTRLAWVLIVLSIVLSLVPVDLFIPDTMHEKTAFLLLFVILIWVVTLPASTTWLIIRYRAFFRSWIGWLLPFLVTLLSSAIAQGGIPMKSGVLISIFSMLQIISLWSMIPITALQLWYKDIGLRMAGWGALIVIWSYFWAWRYEGNLVERLLLSLSVSSQRQSLWWFSPLMLILWWIIPVGMLGFVGHTIRLLILEFREGEHKTKYRVGSASVYLLAVTKVIAYYTTPEAIAKLKQDMAWLPKDLSAFPQDLRQLWPRLCGIAQDVATALASESIYNRRIGFSYAQDDLNALRLQLPTMGEVALQFWQPTVVRWMQVLGRELEQPLLMDNLTLVNPYDAGNPLTARRADLFQGRTDLTECVAGALLERNRPTLVLHGPRKMGKTSFLLQLPRLLPRRTIPVFVDLQRGDATATTVGFLYTVARAIANDARNHSRLTLSTPQRDVFEHEPFGAFTDWLDDEALPELERAGNLNILLCFDEFEKLGQALEDRRVDERVLDELRHIIQHQQAISILFTGVQTLEDLGPRWSSYFINVRPLRIAYLSSGEATDLIRSPASNFHLEYIDAAVADILAATRCHPYLVQLVCSTLVDLANQHSALIATPELVQEALTLSLERGEPYFRALWDETPGADPASLSVGRSILRQIAAASGEMQVEDTPEVARVVDRLLRYDILERGEGGLRFQVPLIGRWMRERAPVW